MVPAGADFGGRPARFRGVLGLFGNRSWKFCIRDGCCTSVAHQLAPKGGGDPGGTTRLAIIYQSSVQVCRPGGPGDKLLVYENSVFGIGLTSTRAGEGTVSKTTRSCSPGILAWGPWMEQQGPQARMPGLQVWPTHGSATTKALGHPGVGWVEGCSKEPDSQPRA
jgi:hypothetical protein